jgi:AcrR family transcriptional regulator
MPRPADPHVKVELLRAAESIFATKGLAAAKVEDITALAGVSKGAFYLHFEGKEDCFRQIVEAFLAQMAARIEPPPGFDGRSSAAPPDEVLAHCLSHDREILEFCWQNRTTIRLVFDGLGGAPYAYLLDEFSERVARSAASWIAQARAAGLYRADVDPDVVALLLAGAYERLARAIVRQAKRPDIEAWTRQAVALFTRGMLTDAARAELDRGVNHRAAADGAARRGDAAARSNEAGTGGASSGRRRPPRDERSTRAKRTRST